MFNTYWEALDFTIAARGDAWWHIAGRSRDISDEVTAAFGSTVYNVTGRSTVILVAA